MSCQGPTPTYEPSTSTPYTGAYHPCDLPPELRLLELAGQGKKRDKYPGSRSRKNTGHGEGGLDRDKNTGLRWAITGLRLDKKRQEPREATEKGKEVSTFGALRVMSHVSARQNELDRSLLSFFSSEMNLLISSASSLGVLRLPACCFQHAQRPRNGLRSAGCSSPCGGE